MRTTLIALFFLLSSCGFKAHPDVEVTLTGLPDFRNYEVDPYIKTAMNLQVLGKEKAVRKLLDLAETEELDHKIIILCRMLFSPRGTALFDRPRIGAASFFGGTTYADWPLEPIEIIDGVPFVIVQGYMIGGQPQSAKSYVMYCFQLCDWNSYQYIPKSLQEKQEALKKLLSSPKWKEPVSETFFAKQIE